MERTIAAISTAVSPSGIGIVRISGPRALKVGADIYRSKDGKKDLSQVPTHTIHYGFIVEDGKVLDQVLVMVMHGPRTYTGEDTVEINCHGGVLAMKRILECVLRHGAVLAQPGEFSKKAFLNGKMDLSQAEAVMDLISSKNELALSNSLRQLKGNLRMEILRLRERILYETAYIESALDDPEHISLEGYPEKLLGVLEEILGNLRRMIQSFADGKRMQEGIRTVIIGKPNAGKSSLLNRLLGEERAIVTEIAGTTRDTLEEYYNLGDVSLHLVDTAGIRDTRDKVENIGVQKALQKAEEADLILYVIDSSTKLDENDERILKLLEGRRAICLYNKTDLKPAVSLENLIQLVKQPVIAISALDGRGMEDLEREIRSMFFSGLVSSSEDLVISNLRHKNLLQETKEALELVREAILSGLPEDFYTIDLMRAYECLGSIIGETVEEDLVDEIFSKFCMGK